MPLKVKKLSAKATLPYRGSEMAAGVDLCSAEHKVVPPQGRAVIKTDLAIACPPGTYGRVAPRSGLAVKKGIHVGAGVVDADYRGPLGVVVFNLSTKDEFVVNEGDRIAQLILESIVVPDIIECDDLDETQRGSGGFGSTGVSKAAATTTATTSTIVAATVSPTATAASTSLHDDGSSSSSSTTKVKLSVNTNEHVDEGEPTKKPRLVSPTDEDDGTPTAASSNGEMAVDVNRCD